MDTTAWRASFIDTLYNLEAPVMSAIDLRKPMDDRLMAQADIAGKRAQYFSCLHACFEILEHPQGKVRIFLLLSYWHLMLIIGTH
jgi:hypothetical protein